MLEIWRCNDICKTRTSIHSANLPSLSVLKAATCALTPPALDVASSGSACLGYFFVCSHSSTLWLFFHLLLWRRCHSPWKSARAWNSIPVGGVSHINFLSSIPCILGLFLGLVLGMQRAPAAVPGMPESLLFWPLSKRPILTSMLQAQPRQWCAASSVLRRPTSRHWAHIQHLIEPSCQGTTEAPTVAPPSPGLGHHPWPLRWWKQETEKQVFFGGAQRVIYKADYHQNKQSPRCERNNSSSMCSCREQEPWKGHCLERTR